jgi:hypothetical protein
MQERVRWCCGVQRWDLTNRLVEEQGLANVLDFGYCALEVECFRQDYFEDLKEVSRSSIGGNWRIRRSPA